MRILNFSKLITPYFMYGISKNIILFIKIQLLTHVVPLDTSIATIFFRIATFSFVLIHNIFYSRYTV